MTKPSLTLATIPAALLEFFSSQVNLRWQNTSPEQLPNWFKPTKAKPVNGYGATELYCLLKAKQERLVTLSLDYDADQLWQSHQAELATIGITEPAQCQAFWPDIEATSRRIVVHSAKLNAQQQLIDNAINDFKTLVFPPVSATANLLIIEPGLKSGLKLAACEPGGKVICHSILFPHEPQNQWAQSIRKLDNFVSSNRIQAIVMATTEGYRESRRFIKCWLKEHNKHMPCYRIRNIGLATLAGAAQEDATDSLYLKVDAIARLALNPVATLSELNLKSLLSNPLLSVVNQSELSRQLTQTWQEISESLATDTLAEDPLFSSACTTIDDLVVGTKLTGEVINQTDYGYFIDVGIQENGLLHNSKLAPGKQPVPGQLLSVTVINVNQEKQQFSLTTRPNKPGRKKPSKSSKPRAPGNSAMADALKAAMTKND